MNWKFILSAVVVAVLIFGVMESFNYEGLLISKVGAPPVIIKTASLANKGAYSLKSIVSQAPPAHNVPKPFSGCGAVLNESNVNYAVVNDISSNYSSTCITIAADNIALSCGGHIISNSHIGININGHSNITLKDCIFDSNEIAVYNPNSTGYTSVDGAVGLINNTQWDIYSLGKVYFNNSYIGTSSSDYTLYNITGSAIAVHLSSAPNFPSGYLGAEHFLKISNLSSNSWAEIVEYYNETTIPVNESTIEMWKYNDSWHLLPGMSVDTNNNVVYSGNVTSFSTFGLLGKPFPIDSCTNLTLPNKVYVLSANISGTQPGRNVCIDIQADNITLNGEGYRINGTNGYGVYSDNKGITIKNVSVDGYTGNIYLNSSSNDVVEGCNLSSSVEGILVRHSGNVNISNNNASFNTIGVDVGYTTNLSITNNSLEGNVNDGIEISHSLNTTISNNSIFNSVGVGVHIELSKVRVLTNKIQSMQIGVDIFVNSLGEVSNNTLFNLSNKAIELNEFLGNVSYNNIKNSSLGIYVGSSNDNISYNYLENNTIGIQFILSHNNYAEGNKYIMNTVGLYLHGVNNSNFSNEIYVNNSWDIYAEQSYGNIMENESINGTKISFKFFNIAIKSSIPTEQVDDGYVDLHKYVRITNTSSNSWIDLNISYSDEEIKQYNLDESTIRLWRFNGTWQPPERAAVINNVDINKHLVYSYINKFSIFTLVGKVLTPSSTTSTSSSNYVSSIEPPFVCSNGVAYYYFHTIHSNELKETDRQFCNDLRINSLKLNKDAYQVKISLKEVISLTNAPDTQYKYFGVTPINVNNSDLSNMSLELRVNKSWIKEEHIAPSTITLYYYDNGWHPIKTTLENDDANYYYFTANTNKLSTFAASGKAGTDFWVVFDMIQKYYADETTFEGVVGALSEYYT